MKKILLTLMIFGSFNLAAKSIFFSCDTLRQQILGDEYRDLTYSRNERVKSLEMNQQENRVVWDTNTSEFIPDGNRDNIYEMEFDDITQSIRLKFNQITKRLKEEKRWHGGKTLYLLEYQCEIVEPLFE